MSAPADGDNENVAQLTAPTTPSNEQQIAGRGDGDNKTTTDRKLEVENKKQDGGAKQQRLRNAVLSRVLLLDGTEYQVEIEVRTPGVDPPFTIL